MTALEANNSDYLLTPIQLMWSYLYCRFVLHYRDESEAISSADVTLPKADL